MGTEIERKFLVINDNWRMTADTCINVIQGYFTTDKKCSIRVRLSGDKANLNIKSATLGVTRAEFDYPIPAAEAQEMLELLCIKPLIEKKRYLVHFGQHLWEVDVFSGENKGLVVAEIELAHIDEDFIRPDWIGAEVSHDPRYYNVCLVKKPYKNWAG
jgi:adenylate cyclase